MEAKDLWPIVFSGCAVVIALVALVRGIYQDRKRDKRERRSFRLGTPTISPLDLGDPKSIGLAMNITNNGSQENRVLGLAFVYADGSVQQTMLPSTLRKPIAAADDTTLEISKEILIYDEAQADSAIVGVVVTDLSESKYYAATSRWVPPDFPDPDPDEVKKALRKHRVFNFFRSEQVRRSKEFVTLHNLYFAGFVKDREERGSDEGT